MPSITRRYCEKCGQPAGRKTTCPSCHWPRIITIRDGQYIQDMNMSDEQYHIKKAKAERFYASLKDKKPYQPSDDKTT